jgi:chromosome segregation ATPase
LTVFSSPSPSNAKDQVVSELVDTKARHETTAALLVQKTLELDSALKDLNATRLQVEAAKEELEKMEGELEESRRTLGSTEEQRSRLEDELVSLKHTLVPLEEAQVQAGEAHRLKEEEMDRQLRKMEQILEEELEQFETLIQAKEEEVSKIIIRYLVKGHNMLLQAVWRRICPLILRRRGVRRGIPLDRSSVKINNNQTVKYSPNILHLLCIRLW